MMGRRGIVIAIDGPAGAGKSTVAKALARDLCLNYLDTGAMYRALALMAQRAGLGPGDGEEAARLGQGIKIDFEGQKVLLDGEDVSKEIRTLEIGELASALSAFSSVRALLVARQKALVAEGGYTLEGRDVTTVVAPDANVKVYLTASLEERAKRRHLELEERGVPGDYGKVRKEMQVRDHRDITREDSPLTVAPGAVVIETAGLTPDEVVEKIKALIPGGLTFTQPHRR
ncbi:MAG TPA: (d)CMP kinase [Fimbriimonadaceae bacterium]|nr:(d)CMP kinase [Fimbriimonadaceae bacterium]